MSKKPHGQTPDENEAEVPTLFDVPEGWEEHWKGMPEFVQAKQRPYAKIIVRFRNQEDLEDFGRLIGQKLNRNSQCTWHPELRQPRSRRRYVSEP
jgi:hypothetical protein